MTTHIGNEGIVQVGGNTVAEMKSFSIDEANNVIDDSEASDLDSTFKPGRNSWTATIECHWDDTDATGQEAMLIGAEVALSFGPEGSVVGDFEFSGSGIITGRSVAHSDESVTAATFSIQGNGALTKGTFA